MLFINNYNDIILFSNPTPQQGPWQMPFRWSRYSGDKRAYLDLGHIPPRMRHNLRADKVAFWNLLIPRLLNATYTPPTVDLRHYETKMWTFLGISMTLLLGVIFLLFLFIKTKINEVQLQQIFVRRPQGV